MKTRIKSLLKRIRSFINAPVIEAMARSTLVPQKPAKEVQLLLSLQYKQLLHLGVPVPGIDEVGFNVYSGSDEDGILHYIYSFIRTTNRKLVDIGAGSIANSNTANLIVNHGWVGLLIDGNERNINKAKSFYSTCPDTRNYPPTLLHTWVTAENINEILIENGFVGEIDLLCIDIDGVDYWIWKAIECITPRVVVAEYQCIWGPEKSVTVPYKPDFQAGYYGRFGIYSGASLSAFVKLGREKGYRLVGCHRYGYNAFFIRNDIGQNILPEVEPAACFKHPFTEWATAELLPKVIDREWIEV